MSPRDVRDYSVGATLLAGFLWDHGEYGSALAIAVIAAFCWALLIAWCVREARRGRQRERTRDTLPDVTVRG